jgi:hypothetical protein
MTEMNAERKQKGPIFIAGPERSGTNLIYALLGSHPNIAMSRRTNMWRHFYNQYGDLSRPKNFERCLSMMMRYKRLLKLNPDPDRIRREFWQGEQTYGRLFALLEEHHAEQIGKPRWGDKSLNTERWADAIFAAYPTARMIHLLRDPRDRFSSSLRRWEFIRSGVGGAAALWLRTVRLASRNNARYPERYMIVRYEDLAGRTEETLRQICSFVDEHYAPEMLAMGGARKFRERGGNSSYGPREPGRISTSSVGKYRQVLSRQQVLFLQAFAAGSMRRYGYAPMDISLSIGEWIQFVGWEFPVNVVLMLAWLLRELWRDMVGREVPSERLVSGPEAVGARS